MQKLFAAKDHYKSIQIFRILSSYMSKDYASLFKFVSLYSYDFLLNKVLSRLFHLQLKNHRTSYTYSFSAYSFLWLSNKANFYGPVKGQSFILFFAVVLYKNQMPFVKRIISEDSMDFTLDDHPKRCSYKKIDKSIKKKIVHLALEEGVTTSELSKRYRVNYSTIAYILKSQREEACDGLSGEKLKNMEGRLKSGGKATLKKVKDPKKVKILQTLQKNSAEMSEGLSTHSPKDPTPSIIFQQDSASVPDTISYIRCFYPFFPFIDYEFS